MHKELLAQSPLIALPLIALFLFLFVFLIESVRAIRRSAEDVNRDASLPLSEDTPHEG